MITLSQISALFQFTYHLILSPLFLFFSEQLFDYPLFYTFLNQNPDEFKPTKSDIEFISILGAVFFFIGFVFLICFFVKNRKYMIAIAFVQIMIHSQIANFLKSFKGVSYILMLTRIEFILGFITVTLVVTDYIVNYGKSKEEEKKKFDEKVEKLKKQYGIKDDGIKKEKEESKSDTKTQKEDKKNN